MKIHARFKHKWKRNTHNGRVKQTRLRFAFENDIRESKSTIFLVRMSVKWQHSPPSKSNMHKSRPLPLRYYVNRSDLWSHLRDFHKGEYRRVNSIERNSRISAYALPHKRIVIAAFRFYCVFDVSFSSSSLFGQYIILIS